MANLSFIVTHRVNNNAKTSLSSLGLMLGCTICNEHTNTTQQIGHNWPGRCVELWATIPSLEWEQHSKVPRRHY
jgi:hypothetical protein